jgi:hypothetical protein
MPTAAPAAPAAMVQPQAPVTQMAPVAAAPVAHQPLANTAQSNQVFDELQNLLNPKP